MNKRTKRGLTTDQLKFYSEVFQFLWERYISSIHLLSLLSGGTVLAVVQTFQLTQPLPADPLLLFIGAGTALFSLCCCIIWRLTSQHFMEREVISNKEKALEYFELTGTDRLTKSFLIQTVRYRSLHRSVEFLAPGTLIISWVFLLLFSITLTSQPRLSERKLNQSAITTSSPDSLRSQPLLDTTQARP